MHHHHCTTTARTDVALATQDKTEKFPPQRIKMEAPGGGPPTWREVQAPPKVVKATVVKDIRKKYNRKKAEKVIAFLVGMCNDFLIHASDGSAYHMARVLWDRGKNREMTWTQKMEVFMRHLA